MLPVDGLDMQNVLAVHILASEKVSCLLLTKGVPAGPTPHTSPTCVVLEGIFVCVWPWSDISLKLCSLLCCHLAHVKFTHIHTILSWVFQPWAATQKIWAGNNANSWMVMGTPAVIWLLHKPLTKSQEAQNLYDMTWSPESLQRTVI